MAGYSRQSSFADTDIIEAADHNNEYNQLVAAFEEASGHKHDGTADEGPVIGLIGDPGDTTPTNKVQIDTASSNIGFWVDVSASAVEQFIVADGKIEPVTDNDIDLGSATKEFKDLYLDGIAYLDTISLNGVTIDNFSTSTSLTGADNTEIASSLAIKTYADGLITALGTVGDLQASNNLSDLANATTARTNLGVEIGADVQAHDALLDDVAALTDPDDDRILFWDDSVGAITWLDMGAGVSISGTTLTATGTAASSATTTTEGIVELATTAEVTTGTDTSRAVTPDALKDGYQGSTNVTTLGTITQGVWNATDVPLSAGGTGTSLTDPNDDRILFWDDSLGAMTWLDIGTGLTLTGTTLDADATSVPSASTTVEGTVELATIAETNTGTDTTRAVTPDGLDGWTGSAQLTTLGTITTGNWSGSNIGLDKGGTGATLVDPNADRIMFWDDSATGVTWLATGTGLTISGTTMSFNIGGNVTGASDDEVVIRDTSDSNNFKTVTLSTLLGGDLVLIETQQAVNNTSIDFTNTEMDGTYDEYVVFLSNVVPASDGSTLAMKTSSDGGTTFDGGASDYYKSGAASQLLMGSSLGSDVNETGLCGIVSLYNTTAAAYTRIHWNVSTVNTVGNVASYNESGERRSAADVDGLRFIMNSGNIESGYFSLYGVKRSI